MRLSAKILATTLLAAVLLGPACQLAGQYETFEAEATRSEGGAAGNDSGEIGVGHGGATGGIGGFPDMPPGCWTATKTPGPHPVTFRFTTSSSVWLGSRCGGPFFSIYSCPNYYEPLVLDRGCMETCSEAGPECSRCSPGCMEWRQAVTSFAPYETYFDGFAFVIGYPSEDCECAELAPLPPGKYRILVSYYLSPEDLSTGRYWLAATDFELPFPNGVVEIELNGGVGGGGGDAAAAGAAGSE